MTGVPVHASNGIASSGTTVVGVRGERRGLEFGVVDLKQGFHVLDTVPGRCADGRVGATVGCVQFSPELRDAVLDGTITLTYRLWTRPQVKVGGRYRLGPGDDRGRRHGAGAVRHR